MVNHAMVTLKGVFGAEDPLLILRVNALLKIQYAVNAVLRDIGIHVVNHLSVLFKLILVLFPTYLPLVISVAKLS